jgi:hypothetical protein
VGKLGKERRMHSIHFVDRAGGTLNTMTSAMRLDDAIVDAKQQFRGARARNPNVVGFRILDNEGKEVMSWVDPLPSGAEG